MRNKKKGIVTILTYIMITVMLIIAGIAMQKAVNGFKLARLDALYTEGLYLSEAGVVLAADLLSENVANYVSEPATGDVYFTITEISFLNTDFDLQYSCTAIEDNRTVTSADGINTYERNYLISVTASHSEYDVEVVLNQYITRKLTPTFQHAVFYDSDLEMLPGPNMTLSGRVHSNSDIYIGTHNTFTIDSEYLYSAGDIFNRRKDSAQSMNGDVNIKLAGSTSYAAMTEVGDSDALDSDRGDWTDESQIRWNGTVKSTVHDVNSLETPAVASVQTDGYYAQQADLKIIKESGGTWDITSSGSSIDIADFPAGTITESTFTDNREGDVVTVTEIDMSLLNSSGYFPSNGLVFLSREDATVAQPNGARIINGSELQDGLTIVSNNPVYIQGDYNNTDKKPAAVICDALNLMSNNWDDSLSNQTLNNRIASDTTINAAFISGIVPTAGGDYSGGLENYPRMHEKWTGKTLYIRGSFVQLWDSEVAQGDWHYGDPIYKAPIRDWDYDTDFNDVNKLPPFTPYAVETETVAWWNEIN